MTSQQDLIDAAVERINLEADALRTVASTIDDRTVAVLRLLLDCPGMVFVTGSGTSGAIARRMAHLFSVSGTPATFMHPGDALHGTMGALRSRDVLVAISRGGESSEINSLAARAQQRGVTVVALTNSPDSSLARLADHVQLFATPAGADPGDLFAMGTNLMHAVWGDAIALVLMRLRGYSWDEVLFTHPSGAVGHLADGPDALAHLTLPD